MAALSAEPNWTSLHQAARDIHSLRMVGRVSQVIGLTIESNGPPVQVGEVCYLHSRGEQTGIYAEAVGFRDHRVLLMPLGEMTGVGQGTRVVAAGRPLSVGVGPGLLGRVLDGLGTPIDGVEPLPVESRYPVIARPP